MSPSGRIFGPEEQVEEDEGEAEGATDDEEMEDTDGGGRHRDAEAVLAHAAARQRNEARRTFVRKGDAE